MRTILPTVLFVLTAVTGYLGFAPSAEAATSSLYHTAGCTVWSDSMNYTYGTGGVLSGTTTGFGYTDYYCPFVSDGDMTHSSVTEVHLHGYDNSATQWFSADTCVTFWNGGGGACSTAQGDGPVSAVPGTTYVTMNVANSGLSAWRTYTSDFPYLTARTYASQQVWGYWVGNY